MGVEYQVYIEPDVHSGRRQLPGNIRQQIGRLIASMADNPRPTESRALATETLTLPEGVEIRRIRMEQWRIVYAVNDSEEWVWVLGIFRRPPYDYHDLAELVQPIA